MEEVLGVSYANVGSAHADSSECAVAIDDNHHRWVELHDVLHSRLDVDDEVTVDEMRRCSAVRSHGELH